VRAERKKIYRKVLYLSIPAIISNLLYTSHIIADTVMLGRYGEADISLSALGFGTLLLFMFFPVVSGIGIGTVAIISRRWGEKKYLDARKVATDSMMTMMALSIPISIIGFFLGPLLIGVLGAEGAVLHEGSRYIRAVFAFYPFNLVILSYHSFLRASGNTRTPMYVDLVTNVYNIGMNYVLIFGKFGFPEMGVLGAGVATGTAFLLGAVIYMFIHWSGGLRCAPYFKVRRKIGWDNIKKLFRIGIPAGLDMGMWTFSFLLLTPMIYHFGSIGYSAHQIGFRAESIAYMPAIGFGIAATTLAGQYLGAKKPKKAVEAVMASTKMVIVMMAIIGAVMIIFSGWIARTFTSENDIIELAALYIFMMGFTEPALGAFFTMIGGLRGAGYTKVPMVVNFAGLVVTRFGLGYLLAFPFGMGLKGIWLAMVIETFGRAVVIYLVFRKGKWKHVNV